jgi:glucose/arabinose dehydrogenase
MWAGLTLAVVLGLSGTVAVLSAAESANSLGVAWALQAEGLVQPVDIAFTGVPTDTRLFAVERDGRIKIVLPNGTVLPDPFLDIDGLSSAETFTEMGLLGLVFDPQYLSNGYFYVYYTDFAPTGDLQLSRFQVSADPNVALTTEVKLLNIPHPGHTNHNGGDLSFGPDGYLYLAPGDGGDSVNAQDLDSLLGKVLRIDVTGVATYTIPLSNPFTDTVGKRPEIWAYGYRNPWRFSFDRQTGDLYIGDVGESAWEEIDRQPAASAGGENYGWPCFEGAHVNDTGAGCPPAGGSVAPIFEYGRSLGQAVTGGFVYRGTAYPALLGYYFFADFGSGRFWALNTGTDEAIDLGLLPEGAQPSSFGQDAAGALYVATFGGKIYTLAGPRVYLPQIAR